MYAIIPQKIPQDRRAEINGKILFAIDSGKDLIPKESIYNCYTGIGGLHNLRQSDFASYHEYAEAKIANVSITFVPPNKYMVSPNNFFPRFFADKKITFTFAYEFIPHLREGNRKTQAIEALRFLLL